LPIQNWIGSDWGPRTLKNMIKGEERTHSRGRD